MKIANEVTLADLSISLPDVYGAMGCDTAFIDPVLEAETKQLLMELSEVLRAQYSFFSVEGVLNPTTQGLTVNDTFFSIGNIIARQLRGSEAFVFFVATAGDAFEQWQHASHIKNDILKSYIADSIGSVIAERVADVMEITLRQQLLSNDWNYTNRYSPGYCGWHVSQQEKLFSLFPDKNPCGIRLTQSYLMLPIKSVSGVIGIGSDVQKHDYTCGLCSYQNCYRRNRR